MNKLTQYGFVENGVLHILNRKRMQADLKEFKDCNVQLIIKEQGTRSLPQNAYYWGIVIEEIRIKFLELGDRYTAEEIHEGLKAKFNPKTTADKGTGEAIFITGDTTTEMNKEGFGVYLDRIIEWCGKSLELIIPEPNTQTKMFEEKENAA